MGRWDRYSGPMPAPAALVTGANSGIGEAICRRLIAEGHHVFAHVRQVDRGARLVEEFGTSGPLQLVEADLREPSGPRAILEAVRAAQAHRLAVIVNNAGGVLDEHSFVPGEVQDAAETLRVNVAAAYEVSVLGAALMEHGSIVNIASVNGTSVMLGARVPLYSSAKAALIQLSRMLAVKLAPHVRVNVVSPGRTLTPAWGQLPAAEERELAADSLIERWVDPPEIADAVWFLTQNRACTGVDLAVDGGIGLKAVLSNT